MTEPNNLEWLDDLLRPLSDKGYHDKEYGDGTRSQCFDCKRLDKAKLAITAKINEICQKARFEEYLWYSDALMDKRMNADDALQTRIADLRKRKDEVLR